jgi:hypothetical protein
MFYRLTAFAVALAISASSLHADDKDKKDAKKDAPEVKGKVVKFDFVKKCVTLKADDKEKEYVLGDEVAFQGRGGGKFPVISKNVAQTARGMQILSQVLRPGNEITLVLEGKDNKVSEVKLEKAPAPPAKPSNVPGAPKNDTQKKAG